MKPLQSRRSRLSHSGPAIRRRAGAAICLLAAFFGPLATPSAHAEFRASGKTVRDGSGLRVPAETPVPSAPRLDETTRCGCAQSADDRKGLLTEMGVDDAAFLNALEGQAPPIVTDTPGCTPFALSRDRDGTVRALAIRAASADGGQGWLLTLARDRIEDGGVLLQSERVESVLQDLDSITATIPAATTPAQAVRAALPPEVLSDLKTLLPMLLQAARLDEDSANVVRLTFDVGTPERWARLLGAELIDRASGSVLADAFWVDRGDLPGGFFNPMLGEFEHTYWTNPVSFTRISRGVGRSRLGASKARKAPPAQAAKGKAKASKSRRPVIQVGRQHIGVDFAAPTGTPVIAVSDGVVTHMGRSGAYGNLIVLTHPGGYTTHYAHLTDYAEPLREGSEVRRGTEIGYVGSTGRSTGPHLHFEVRQAGRYLDPLNVNVGNGPWHWSAPDRLSLLRQMLITDALAAARPLPLAADGPTTLPVYVRHCTQAP